jgi:hypothetical protein
MVCGVDWNSLRLIVSNQIAAAAVYGVRWDRTTSSIGIEALARLEIS